MTPRMKWLVMIALPAVVGLSYLTASAHFGYTPDDTYIYLRFARNLLSGGGFAFNPGEPTYGVTSPLWLFLITLAGKSGADLFTLAKVLDLLFAAMVPILCYLVAFEISRDVAVSLCATVACSVNGWLLRWAGTGMESSLAAVLALSVLLFCLRNEYLLSVILAACLTLVRPEGAFLLPLVFTDLYVNSHDGGRAWRFAFLLGLVFAALLAPWLVYAVNTFGTFLPNTGLAKSGLHLSAANMWETAVDIVRTLGATDGVAIVVLLGSALLLAFRYARRTEESRESWWYFFRQHLVCVGWIVVLPILYVVMDVNVVSRYLLLIVPMITISACTFAAKVLEESPFRRHLYAIVFAIAGLVVLQNQIVYRQVIRPGIDVFEEGMESCLIPIASWLKSNTPPRTRVAATDIGAIGYFSDRYVCDAAGLTTREILPFIAKGFSPEEVIAQKLYTGVCDVDYVIHRGKKPLELGTDTTLLPIVSKPFYGLKLGDSGLLYYTLYKVRKTGSGDEKTD